MAPDRATARHQPPLNDAAVTDGYKRAAAEVAAKMVEDGMRVGLGTGSTVAFLLPALAERKLHGLRCVAVGEVSAASHLHILHGALHAAVQAQQRARHDHSALE